MDSINRSVAVIKPGEPFWEWLNGLPDTEIIFTFAELQTDCTVLLIREYDINDQAHKFIRRIYKEIFERELETYCSDSTYWPSIRGYKTFLQWFDIELHSEVLDTVNEDIVKERCY